MENGNVGKWIRREQKGKEREAGEKEEDREREREILVMFYYKHSPLIAPLPIG